MDRSGDSRSASAFAPTVGTTVRSAAITCVQNATGSLSPGSSESHAVTDPSAGAAPSHSARSVDLPNPAGADTSVSFDRVPRCTRSVRCGRDTRPFGRLGA